MYNSSSTTSSSTSSSSTTSTTLSTTQNACNQRKINMLFNIPPVRLQKVSPYPTYTSQQLNMRRKVEILKYKKNSTQGSQLTAKQRQALISRGNYRGNTVVCTKDHLIPLRTSRSGVPGPIIELVEDQSVPLYNYVKNQFASAVEVTDPKYEWLIRVTYYVDCPASLTNSTNIAMLLIKESITSQFTTFTYSAPVVYYLTGTNIPIDTSGVIVNVELNNMASNIYYGGNPILNNTSVVSFENQNFQVSLQPDSSNTGTTYDYYAKFYAGYMTISNIYLSTYPGFVYNIDLTYNASETVDYSQVSLASNETTTIINNSTFSLTANIDDYYYIDKPQNCEIITSSSTNSKDITFDSFEDTVGAFVNVLDNTNIINYSVTVDHGTNNYDPSGNKYYIDSVISPDISFVSGKIYNFYQSDYSNTGHQLLFSTTPNGTHDSGTQYSDNVIIYGTPGIFGSYTSIVANDETPNLYYYCANHNGMGNGSSLYGSVEGPTGESGTTGTSGEAGTTGTSDDSSDTSGPTGVTGVSDDTFIYPPYAGPPIIDTGTGEGTEVKLIYPPSIGPPII